MSGSVVVVLVARSSDGYLLSLSDKKLNREYVKNAKKIFYNATLLPNQVSLETGDVVFHYQKGPTVTSILITPPDYSVMEAFGRMSQIQEDFTTMYTADKIQRMGSFVSTAVDDLRASVEFPFDENNSFSSGEKPPRQHISEILNKINAQPFGFSTGVIKKKKKVILEWKEIALLVPLTLIAFIKMIVAFKIHDNLTIITSLLSTAVAFYLVFICVHDLLTTKRLMLSSLLLLVLTYGTTFTSLASVLCNGAFALLTLANVAHYYLRPAGARQATV